VSVDLATRYLGLELASPLVASASPLGGHLDTLRRLEDSGAAAVVLPSLFEEQIEHEELSLHWTLEAGAGSHAEATAAYFPELDQYATGPGEYLEHVAAAKAALSIPVIASLNGSSPGGWTRYARLIEEAGADALELNLYAIETDPEATAPDVEARLLGLVSDVRASVGIPLAVKVGPYFTAFAHTARELVAAGANGLVLFNRLVQPDLDPEGLTIGARVQLSTREEHRLPIRWIAILKGRIDASLAATGGIHEPIDVVKALLAGADVTMLASALLERGPEWLSRLSVGLSAWLEEHEYDSVEQMKGSMSQISCPDPTAFERASYMRALTTFGRPDAH
jgi:dihydroorotate dehydrogenase (fumarate)